MHALIRRFIPLAFATLLTLSACSRMDPIATDLVALNTAGQNAMASANVNQSMAKVQAAKTPAEKAAILRESSQTIERARAELMKVEMKSNEVRDIQARMASGFGKAGLGATAAANAFESAAPADMEKARDQMREGQMEFLTAAQDMVKLAKARSVDLTKKGT